MKVCILTEGGERIGMGHISRCTALKEELSARGIENVLYINEEWRGETLDFLEGSTAVVDSYLASESQIEDIYSRVYRCIFIDDNNIRDYPGGIVINPTLYGHELDYPDRNEIKYLLGRDYVILREPFRKQFNKKISDEIQTITITIGGTDPESLTISVLRALKDRRTIIKNVVINPASPCYEQVLELRDGSVRIYKALQAEKMRDLLLASDLVISAGGQTINELIQLRIPSLFVQAADNQRRNLDYIRVHGLGMEISRESFENEVSEKIDMMDYPTRKAFYENMTEYDFSKGVERIANELGELNGTHTIRQALY